MIVLVPSLLVSVWGGGRSVETSSTSSSSAQSCLLETQPSLLAWILDYRNIDMEVMRREKETEWMAHFFVVVAIFKALFYVCFKKSRRIFSRKKKIRRPQMCSRSRYRGRLLVGTASGERIEISWWGSEKATMNFDVDSIFLWSLQI